MKEKNKKPIPSAVALKYNRLSQPVPKLAAKGKGVVAEKIIELAKKHNIPIKEDPDLVQVLSKLDLDQEVPAELYKVIAEVLAWVYRLNRDFARH